MDWWRFNFNLTVFLRPGCKNCGWFFNFWRIHGLYQNIVFAFDTAFGGVFTSGLGRGFLVEYSVNDSGLHSRCHTCRIHHCQKISSYSRLFPKGLGWLSVNTSHPIPLGLHCWFTLLIYIGCYASLCCWQNAVNDAINKSTSTSGANETLTT